MGSASLLRSTQCNGVKQNLPTVMNMQGILPYLNCTLWSVGYYTRLHPKHNKMWWIPLWDVKFVHGLLITLLGVGFLGWAGGRELFGRLQWHYFCIRPDRVWQDLHHHWGNCALCGPWNHPARPLSHFQRNRAAERLHIHRAFLLPGDLQWDRLWPSRPWPWN